MKGSSLTPTSPDPLDEILITHANQAISTGPEGLYTLHTEARAALTAWKDQAVRDALKVILADLPEKETPLVENNIGTDEFPILESVDHMIIGFNEAIDQVKALIQQKVSK